MVTTVAADSLAVGKRESTVWNRRPSVLETVRWVPSGVLVTGSRPRRSVRTATTNDIPFVHDS